MGNERACEAEQTASGNQDQVGLVSGALLVATLVFGTAPRGEYTVLSEQLIYALLFFFRAKHDRFGLDGLSFTMRP